jgi:hypothetical protein
MLGMYKNNVTYCILLLSISIVAQLLSDLHNCSVKQAYQMCMYCITYHQIFTGKLSWPQNYSVMHQADILSFQVYLQMENKHCRQ